MDHGAGKGTAWLESARRRAELASFPEPAARTPAEAGAWAVPWSDLMMVMFVLFLVLYATQTSEVEVGTTFDEASASTQTETEGFAIADPRTQDPTDPKDLPGSVYEESLAAVETAGFEEVEVLLRPDESVQVDLDGALFFELGSAELGARAQQLLQQLALVLAAHQNRVEVIGHTDAQPIRTSRFPSNWELSTARASAVTRHLIRYGGLDPRRFRVVGLGHHAPAGLGSDGGAKARNRRVEIIIQNSGTAR